MPVYAEEITVSDSETDIGLPKAEEIIPPEVSELLSQNGISLFEGNVSDNVFSFIISVISSVFYFCNNILMFSSRLQINPYYSADAAHKHTSYEHK